MMVRTMTRTSIGSLLRNILFFAHSKGLSLSNSLSTPALWHTHPEKIILLRVVLLVLLDAAWNYSPRDREQHALMDSSVKSLILMSEKYAYLQRLLEKGTISVIAVTTDR